MTSRLSHRVRAIRACLLVVLALGVILDADGGRLQAGPEPLRVSEVAHDGARPLRAGALLWVSVRGTAGATATFTVAGATSHVAMHETHPGVYQGVYSVRTSDNVKNGVVVGWLRKDRDVAFAAATPVTLDTSPPRVLRRFPNPGEVVKALRPGILIAVADAGGTGLDFRASRLVVNGQDVTEHTVWAATSIGYSPATRLIGRVAVELVLADLAGNVTRDHYVFYVGTGPEAR